MASTSSAVASSSPSLLPADMGTPRTPPIGDREIDFNDWDIPLGLLRELYLRNDQPVHAGLSGTIAGSSSNNAIAGPSNASPVLSSAASVSLLQGSSSPSPHTPPTVTPHRLRADSAASNISSVTNSSSAAAPTGSLRRAPSLSHAAVPRHATASRRRPGMHGSASGFALQELGETSPGGGSAIGSSSNATASAFGLHTRDGQLPPSSSAASIALLNRKSSFQDRQRVMSYSPAQRNAYLPTRILNFENKKRILVTGGAGFVGSHLVDRLMLMGHEVMVVDNFFTGLKSSLAHWVGHPNFELVRHDVVNPLLVEVDQIYHLACPASPKSYQVNQIKTLKTNFMGTMNMLGLAKRTKARFLLASTSEVYGDPDVHPQPESYNGNVNITGPRGCYDEGKRIAETLTYGYLYQDGVDVRVARIFNTYGPRMHPYDGRVVSNFILQGLKGEPLTVYGDGSQTRSFMFIHDLVDALIAQMNVEAGDLSEAQLDPQPDDEGTEKERDELLRSVHGPVNIGNPNEFTIKELIEQVDAAVQQVKQEMAARGRPITPSLEYTEEQAAVDGAAQTTGTVGNLQVIYCPMPADDPRQRRPDTSRAKRLLQWEPRWSLKEGLLEMTRYYAQQLEEGSM